MSVGFILCWLHDYLDGAGGLDQLVMHLGHRRRLAVRLLLLLVAESHRRRSFALFLDLFDPALGTNATALHLFAPDFLATCYQVVVGALEVGVGLVWRQRVDALVPTGETKFGLVLQANFFNF